MRPAARGKLLSAIVDVIPAVASSVVAGVVSPGRSRLAVDDVLDAHPRQP